MPILPRAQLFEFNDRDWVPESLRDTIVETLSRSLDWGGFLAPLAPVINLGADRILGAMADALAAVAKEATARAAEAAS